MARCGIARIDHLLEGTAHSPLARGETDVEAVGVIQDSLTGHGFRQLPAIRDSLYGRFGPKTQECVRGFQQRNGLHSGG